MRAEGHGLLQKMVSLTATLKIVLLEARGFAWPARPPILVGGLSPLGGAWTTSDEIVRHPLFVLELAEGGDCGSGRDEDAVILSI